MADDNFWDFIPFKMLTALSKKFEKHTRLSRELYETMAFHAENYLRTTGLGGTAARKQARGAARQFLPSCLETEFLFSASIAQWKRMIAQRLSDPADAEIRMLFGKILETLKTTVYGNYFNCFDTVAAEDEYGVVVVE
jgi:thymidylate synthase ThyX